MKLSADDKVLTENKVLLLYILNKVNKPLTNEALLKLVVSITDMNYFYFQQFLLDLLNSKYVFIYEGEETVYSLTDEGRAVLSLTKNIIPGILKFKVDNDFKENLNEINDEISITAEFTPESETEYTVKCKIVENNRTLFQIQTFAGSREQAKDIVENWQKNANEIYPRILDILAK